jgi:hypothetical protein
MACGFALNGRDQVMPARPGGVAAQDDSISRLG